MSPSSNAAFGKPSASMQLDPASQIAFGPSSQNHSGPPLGETFSLHSMTSAEGQVITPQIIARIDKGFFYTEKDWTCYRRNYFAVNCSYALRPHLPSTALYLNRSNTSMPELIQGFAMSISAVVDGPGGKAIELVQHTPKRDKAPTTRPERVKLNPSSTGTLGMFPGSGAAANATFPGSGISGQAEYDQSYAVSTSQPNTVANFERIQFKNATANNGKRRAAQQYYHLVVELYADVRSTLSSEPRYIKVATRMSERMVVRGRSPGHYSDDRRASSSSTGPGGASGGGGADGSGNLINPAGPPPSGARLGSSASVLGGPNSLSNNGAYRSYTSPVTSGTNSLSVSSSSSSLGGHPGDQHHPIDPILSAEDGSEMDPYPDYQYYPSPLYDDQTHQQLRQYPSNTPTYKYERGAEQTYSASLNGPADNSMRYHHAAAAAVAADDRRLSKGEFTQHAGQALPTFGSPYQSGGGGGADISRGCGRYQGTETSRGYYPDLSAAL
ncbi:MAG: hypothetical protein M1819_003239 [Sarea resinae]|nr:MAG: hypothetical protein M1819_003239 [Sarea resinae]